MAKKSVDMTSGPLLSKIVLFIIPLLITDIIQRLYTLADMLVVGRFAGSSALAAVGSTSHFISLITGILGNIAIGVSAVTAQALGAKDNDCVNRTVHTAMAISLLGSIIFALTGIIFCKRILYLMDTPESIIDKAALYMRIILAGYPVSAIYNFGAAIIRAKGDSKSPLVFLTISGIINVILNMIFVIVFGMGVEGVALATILSQIVSALFVIKSLESDNYPYKIQTREIKIHFKEFKRIMFIGVPIAMQGMLSSFSNMVLQSAVNSFGEITVAGAAAALDVISILYIIVVAPSRAATIFTGQNIGAEKYDRVLKVLLYSISIVLILGIPSCCLVFIFGKQLIGLFVKEHIVIEQGLKILNILAPIYFICGIPETLSCCLKGMNKSVHSMISSVTGQIGIRVLWILTFFPAHRSLKTLYLVYPISWTFVIIADAIIFLVCFKKLKRKEISMVSVT